MKAASPPPTDPGSPAVLEDGPPPDPPEGGGAAEPGPAGSERSERAAPHSPAAERAAALRAAAERAAAERARAVRARVERERAERERAALAAQAERERAERERVERERAALAAPAERERAEQDARERAEQDARERADQDARERAEGAAEDDVRPRFGTTPEGQASPTGRRPWRLMALVVAVAAASVIVWQLVSSRGEPVIRLAGGNAAAASPAATLVIEQGTVSLDDLRDAAVRLGRRQAVITEGPQTLRLTMPVVVEQGGTLEVDHETLRLDSGGGSNVALEARGGTIRADHATVLSWDVGTGSPDSRPDDGRAFVSATDRGRLELQDSSFRALGYPERARTGVSWVGPDAGGYARRCRFQDSFTGAALLSITSGVELSDSAFERSTGPGLFIAGGQGLDVQSGSFLGNGAEGLRITDGSRRVRVLGGESGANRRSGVTVDGQSSGVDLLGLRAHGNHERGISASGTRDLLLHDAVVSANHVGVLIDLDSSVRVEQSRISGNRAAGVWVRGDGSTATILANHLDHNGGAGVMIFGGKVTVGPDDTIVDNTIGIRVEDPTPDVAVTDTTIEHNADVGVSLVAAQGLRLDGNRLTENGSAPFASRIRYESTQFATRNTVLPGQLGWEIVRGPPDAPPPTLESPPPLRIGAPPGPPPPPA